MATAISPRILRYEVPVDDHWHTTAVPRGPIVHVAARRPDIVEFWVLSGQDNPPITLMRRLRVFGTGQPIPLEATRHIGSALTANGSLVWHLMEQE